MKIKKNGPIIFIISFLASIIILGIVFFAVSLFTKTSNVTNEQQDIPYEKINPSRDSDKISFLLFGVNEDDSDLGACIHIDYIPKEDRYTIVLFPPELLLNDYSISEHFSKDVLFAKNEIDKLFGATTDRYIILTKRDIIKLLDFIGGITFYVEEDKLLNGQKILKGKQLLDGRRVAELLFEKHQGLYNVNLQYQIVNDVINQRFNSDIINKLDGIFDLLFIFKTTFNKYDILSRDVAFKYTLESKQMVATSIIIEGIYNKQLKLLEPDRKQLEQLKMINK